MCVHDGSLPAALSSMASLRHLDLSHTRVSPTALPALARLDLSDNSLNDWAASALAAVLPRLPALAELDLRGSNFSPQAQAELLKAAAGRRVAIAF